MFKKSQTIKILVLFSTLFLFTGCGEQVNPVKPPDGKYAEVAKCITSKGAIMYGAYWCSHCQNTKAAFGNDFQYIKYQECDPSGPNGNMKICLDAGISGYPTWVFPGQGALNGEQQIFVLAKVANCVEKLPQEDQKLLQAAEKAAEEAGNSATKTSTTPPAPAAGTTGTPEPVGRTTSATTDQTVTK